MHNTEKLSNIVSIVSQIKTISESELKPKRCRLNKQAKKKFISVNQK